LRVVEVVVVVEHIKPFLVSAVEHLIILLVAVAAVVEQD
jgi:hypothetical protein